VENEIPGETAALVTALENRDVAGAVEAYADGARLLSPAAGLVEGRAQIGAYWQAGLDLGLSALAFETRVLEEVAGAVLEVGRYAFSGWRRHAEPRVDRGTYLVLHTLGPDGVWRRGVEVFNPDEPGSARHEIQKEES
jgi:ketosteroid isomerase-like protein